MAGASQSHHRVKSHQGGVPRQAGLTTVWESAGTHTGGVADSLSLPRVGVGGGWWGWGGGGWRWGSDCQSASLFTDESKYHQVAIGIRGQRYADEFLFNACWIIVFIRNIGVEGTLPFPLYLFLKKVGEVSLYS